MLKQIRHPYLQLPPAPTKTSKSTSSRDSSSFTKIILHQHKSIIRKSNHFNKKVTTPTTQTFLTRLLRYPEWRFEQYCRFAAPRACDAGKANLQWLTGVWFGACAVWVHVVISTSNGSCYFLGSYLSWGSE